MENVTENAKTPTASKKNKKKTVIALIIAVVSVLFLVLLVNATQAMVLKVHIKHRWEDVRSEGLHILDISNDTITYRVCFDGSNTPIPEQRANAVTVATYKYKAISRTKIKVLRENGDWETITVKFPWEIMSDYSCMDLYPALTTDGEKDSWWTYGL